MRTESEITAELATLEKPPIRIGFLKDAKGMEAAERWCRENPEKSARYDALVDELQALEAKQREQEAKQRWTNRLREGGLGERLIEAAESPGETPALLATRDWLKSEKAWLVLSGNVGTGKSVAAAVALIMEARRSEFGSRRIVLGAEPRAIGTIAFRRASALVRMSAFDEGAKELAWLKSVSMLVVDDLGTEHSTSWGTSLIHEIFDTRHDDKLRTIITTNIGRDALKTALGDRLTDRIAQDGRVVYLDGKSMRRSS